MQIQESVSLKEKNTLKIGGLARFFAEVFSIEDIKEATVFARSKQLPIFVLGGGSNVLISDEGFPGLVLRVSLAGISWQGGEVVVGAGESWDEFVEETIKKKNWGLENLSGIPGTVGAAPIQNIGAYGTEVKDVIKEVRAFNVESGEVETFSNADCQFAYRDSVFKKPEFKKYIITEVVFSLSATSTPKLEYRDLKLFFDKTKEEPTLENIRKAVLLIRAKKFPDLSKFGTAGSFFKNPIIPRDQYETLKGKYPELPMYEVDAARVKVPLAWILDVVLGRKGYRVGDVGLFENQPLVLVNFGTARATEIKNFSAQIKKEVLEKVGIEIEEEVQTINNEK